ncbi:MAG: hypothetical protein WCR20_20715, partial [Verrucomicrobiota bacterium]
MAAQITAQLKARVSKTQCVVRIQSMGVYCATFAASPRKQFQCPLVPSAIPDQNCVGIKILFGQHRLQRPHTQRQRHATLFKKDTMKPRLAQKFFWPQGFSQLRIECVVLMVKRDFVCWVVCDGRCNSNVVQHDW